MQSYNKVIQVGRLTADPEIRRIPSGTAVCEFSIAVTRSWKEKDSEEWKEHCSFFNCVTWGNKAEYMQDKFHKGDQVLVEGRLEQDRWETPEGDKRSKIKIITETVKFVAAPKGRSPEDAIPEGYNAFPDEEGSDPGAVPF